MKKFITTTIKNLIKSGYELILCDYSQEEDYPYDATEWRICQKPTDWDENDNSEFITTNIINVDDEEALSLIKKEKIIEFIIWGENSRRISGFDFETKSPEDFEQLIESLLSQIEEEEEEIKEKEAEEARIEEENSLYAEQLQKEISKKWGIWNGTPKDFYQKWVKKNYPYQSCSYGEDSFVIYLWGQRYTTIEIYLEY